MKLTSDDIANAIVNVCEMPAHVVVEEMTVWGNDQEVVPFKNLLTLVKSKTFYKQSDKGVLIT